MRRREFLLAAGGATGTAAATTSGGVAAAREGTATPTPGNGNATAPAGESGGTTHTVNMTDGLVFDPDSITIAPGDTIEWVNIGNQPHSVTAYEEGIPEEAEYFASGGFDSEDAAREDWGGAQEGSIGGGESYTHTFEVEGTYEYFCIPHEGAGMVGEVEVTAGAGESGGAEEVDPEEMGVPFQAHWVGIATLLGLVLALLVTFFVLKYGETPHSGYPGDR